MFTVPTAVVRATGRQDKRHSMSWNLKSLQNDDMTNLVNKKMGFRLDTESLGKIPSDLCILGETIYRRHLRVTCILPSREFTI